MSPRSCSSALPLVLAVLVFGTGSVVAQEEPEPAATAQPETTAAAEPERPAEEEEQSDKKRWRIFRPYRKNYFVVAPDDYEAKFQISFASKLQKKPLFGLLQPLFTYTQKSFWALAETSSPFRESNYNPEVMLEWSPAGSRRGGWELPARVRFGWAHESNGRDGRESRSWDRLFLESEAVLQRGGGELTIGLRVWHILEDGDNPDIERYHGYGEVWVEYDSENLKADLRVRRGSGNQNGNPPGGLGGGRGGGGGSVTGGRSVNLEGDLAFRYPRDLGFLWNVHAWTGYGESLIDLEIRQTRVRVGILLNL